MVGTQWFINVSKHSFYKTGDSKLLKIGSICCENSGIYKCVHYVYTDHCVHAWFRRQTSSSIVYR